MGFSIKFDTVKSGWSIVYIERLQVIISKNIIFLSLKIDFVLFGLKLNIQVNSYGHVGTVSSPNHTFSLGRLEQAVNQYFVHIFSLATLVTDNIPS